MDLAFEVIEGIADFFDGRKLSKSQRKKMDLENQKINEIVKIISKYYYISSKGHSYIELKHDGKWSVSVENINIIK